MSLDQGHKNAIEEQVAQGVPWMDQHWPEWWEQINPQTLRMSDPRQCILGQSGPLTKVLVDMFGVEFTETNFHTIYGFYQESEADFAETYGFDLDYTALDEAGGNWLPTEAWDYLRQCWVEEIELRRETA